MIENEALTASDESIEGVEELEAPETSDEETGAAEATAEMATLVLKRAGAETEHVFKFGSPAVLGRFDPAVGPIDIDLAPLEEGVYVSRRHAKFTYADGVWHVEDLGSSNGTFLLRSDFERVESAELQDGDELAFGNARFVFRAE